MIDNNFIKNFYIMTGDFLYKLFHQEANVVTHTLQTFTSRDNYDYTFSTNIFIKRQLFKTKCVSDWSIRLTSRLALMEGPKKPEPLEIRYCSAPTQGAHSGREINKDISLKHSTNLHYMYPSVTVYGIQPSLFTLEKTACKLSHKCRSN